MKLKHISHFHNHSNCKLFGLSSDNEEIHCFELINKNGMKVQLTNYGATVTSLKVPALDRRLTDVVLGFDNANSYIESYNLPSAPYFGTTVGRYAGRINKGRFTLNDKIFELAGNNNGNALHGGNTGFGQKIWDVTDLTDQSVTFHLISGNLEENYPGELQVFLTYTLTEENELKLEYKASSSEDTIINLTHHSYFNLNGHDSDVLDQEMFIDADKMLETNDESIPTGKFIALDGHNFDFRTAKNCPASIDNSFVINSDVAIAAQLLSPKNNLKMSVYTDQPSVHIYVGGNCFDILKGKENVNYTPVSGICFETQNFPDAPNHNHFPNSVLKKGDEYQQTTIYKFENIK
ncbi:aldose epimerase family protein [Flavobacterium chungangense]|uniref:Aldose 1-epimerase n=1 Tax=Flavobacterium chungangense TaxID=554283 RepID=A0A6V6YTY3_9FLAO|nr:aldose epimerase family protein [Flavobacterium chungangense]CAD0002951.1 galactose mutarotase [Flavobacterium chungangense]